jgi:4-hydroxy-3-methylbut-2-enyl diphosphate reductase
VDYADEIEDVWLDGVSTVGVTSGASVPEVLVRDVLAHLAEQGFGEAETVVAAEESLLFALPSELRRDLKARSGDEPDQVRHDPSSLAAGALR